MLSFDWFLSYVHAVRLADQLRGIKANSTKLIDEPSLLPTDGLGRGVRRALLRQLRGGRVAGSGAPAAAVGGVDGRGRGFHQLRHFLTILCN